MVPSHVVAVCRTEAASWHSSLVSICEFLAVGDQAGLRLEAHAQNVELSASEVWTLYISHCSVSVVRRQPPLLANGTQIIHDHTLLLGLIAGCLILGAQPGKGCQKSCDKKTPVTTTTINLTQNITDKLTGLLAVQVQCFGLAMVRLDIRQESTRHSEAIAVITKYLGIGDYKYAPARAWPGLLSEHCMPALHNLGSRLRPSTLTSAPEPELMGAGLACRSPRSSPSAVSVKVCTGSGSGSGSGTSG